MTSNTRHDYSMLVFTQVRILYYINVNYYSNYLSKEQEFYDTKHNYFRLVFTHVRILYYINVSYCSMILTF